jgi:cbb3-type cytochrome oxidase subunit 3
MTQHLVFTPPDDRYRRLAGLWLGALLGLVYGMASQFLNRALLPGVPLHQPPFGAAGNILMIAAAGALLGLIAAWPNSSLLGISLASGVSALAILVSGFLSAPADATAGSPLGLAFIAAFLFLPFWALLAPLIAALRWGVNHQEEAHRDRLPIRARLGTLVILVLLVALAGTFYLYRSGRRTVLANANALLAAAQAAPSPDAWPAALRAPAVGPLADHLDQRYELSWEREGIARYRIPRPAANFDNHSAVIARFADGWNLVCIYIAPEEPPICRGFDKLP